MYDVKFLKRNEGCGHIKSLASKRIKKDRRAFGTSVFLLLSHDKAFIYISLSLIGLLSSF